MLIAETKQQDTQIYQDVLWILEHAVLAYTRTGDETLIPEIERLDKWASDLQTKITTYDYSEDEKRLKHVIKLSTCTLTS